MGIFGKSDTRPAEAPPARGVPPPPATPPRSAPCVIGAKTRFKGELTAEEDVTVEGTVEGHVKLARDLHVAQGGTVRADVSASSIVVSGEVVGDCSAQHKVELHATGRLTGNIRAPRIVIAEGAVFKGNSDMSGRKDDRKEHPGAP
jgi:cytoskeletal protein CcmA (bactofilin family)